jgi:UDP-N-acetylglucosamine 4,6-dehydratase
MRGGEIFVPRIPSVRIVDLATAMAPDLPQKVVGIRPGEKIHEVMCPADDSHLTLAFADHFVIRPAITFTDRNNSFSPNGLGEEGVPVEQGFEFNSGRNEHFLSVPEILEFNSVAGEA